MNFIKKLFGKKELQKTSINESKWTDEESEAFYLNKEKALEVILGKSANVVGHAIIPFSVGGAIDMYYYPNHIQGTGFATQELIEPDGSGSIPNCLGTYELVAFTRIAYEEPESIGIGLFGAIERHICGTFTFIGNYSFDAKLEPGDTCVLPFENEPNRYLIFDGYKPRGLQFEINGNEHGLLLVIEIFESEMKYAMENGSSELFKLLKEKEFYPYSDLNRESVI